MPISTYSAESTDPGYTTLRSIDIGTFNEYRYKITEQFFVLRDKWEIDGELHKWTLEKIGLIANDGYKFLPDNLQNKNLLKKLLTDLQRGVQYPNNDANYTEIIKSISDYLDKADIDAIKWSVKANPESGNAPMNVTLRGAVSDPTGTQIPSYNYTWWMDVWGKQVVIGRGISINYTFKEEWNFSVFLDVVSNHKNSEGNVDVLPFRSRADIEVKEKIASLIIKVNGDRLENSDIIKFNPSEASYGLLFDATSSTPTGGAKFNRTEWDFWNGVTRVYNGAPRVERVVYAKEGEYTVSLKLVTNESKIVERKFVISINDPIATISSSQGEGYVGDKFTFSAKSSGREKNLSYAWEIVDIEKDEIIVRKSDKLFTHTFEDKGRYNVILKVTQVSGETDIDTQIIYINSRAPIAEFTTKIPLLNKPNRVFFDASRSYDPDFSDDGKLTYTWYIDGQRVNLEDANSSGSVGYYVFDSVGSHDVSLEVRDPDNIVALKKGKVDVNSILSVEMFAFPRVIQRESFIRFVAESPEAEIYEWDFGDGTQKWWSEDTINHTFNKSWAFDVKLRVRDADNQQNTFTKTVYVWESDTPVAILDVSSDSELITYDASACSGKGWYIASRVSSLKFDASESINVDGQNSWLDYTWKIGNSKFATTSTVNHKFDEIGCFPVKLSVTSQKNWKTSTRSVNIEVENKLPVVSALGVNIQNEDADPLVVTVDALGANDPDGIIQSYLWYYYTDTDTEPQDFRSSTKPSTTFVLPKITGQYYFVVIMKDNNEARISSEEATGSRYFTTITGDNINTPLIDLSINDSSVSIGDEVIFTTQVKDILGKDISKDSKYSWDFDGDGFYDMEWSEKAISYKYKKSWTFYAKVKVKHKWISTTKSITVNVSNKIVPDFDYISIGNKYIFFDTSNGELDSRQWDLWDGTKVSGKTFVHEYTDNLSTHTVTLKVAEGTKTKEVEKKVVKNVKNILTARSEGMNLFSTPEISDAWIVTLEHPYEKFYIYLGESKWEISAYAIDYDITLDSDLNGGKDDDRDNKWTGSYTSGDVLEIPLNPLRTQNIRIFLIASDESIIESRDITLIKSYIEEIDIDFNSIEFLNVTESEKTKIEELKKVLSALPQAQKLIAMNYVQRMQENWSDKTEKTRVIIEFETYLFDEEIENVDIIIEILESLLVEWQEDKSNKNVALNALKNLIPQTITCDIKEGYDDCYSMLISQLDEIYDTDNVEKNKAIGSSILKSIQDTDTMTNQQKLDFKAVLSALVYGGLVNIPEDEVEEVVDNPIEQEKSDSKIIGILVTISYILWMFLCIFLGILVIFFIWYKLSGQSKDIWLQEFITQKTSFKKSEPEIVQDITSMQDILWDDLEKQEKKVENITQNITSSPDEIPDPLARVKETKVESKESQKKEEMPNWLAGNFEKEGKKTETKGEEKKIGDSAVQPQNPKVEADKTQQPRVEIKKEDNLDSLTKLEDEPIPDWLKWDVEKEQIQQEPKAKDIPTSSLKDDIPDWLKGSLDESSMEKKQDEKIEKKEEKEEKDKKEQPNQQSKEDAPVVKKEIIARNTSEQSNISSEKVDEPILPDDVSVPDWLKGSLDEKSDIKKEENKQEESKKEAKDISSEVKKTPTTKKETSIKKPSSWTQKKVETKEENSQWKKKTSTSKKDDTELWDDGMKVPDWLKSWE